ncbi:MAG: hypothetical protein J6M60_00380 [Clostridia bacterium]|nr:hypothetical protein [Clostridia bacterium]
MRNKYNYGELVKVSGIGKEFGKVENRLGFIIEKDEWYEEYNIDLIFGPTDWFSEKSIERVLGEKRNKTEKYQVRLCTTKDGYELLKNNIKKKEPISNNKFKKIDIYKKFEKDNKTYIIIGWKSVYWPVSNKSINVIETTIDEFKENRIPFQYVLLNEDVLTDIRTIEHLENDNNVKVFSIERKIKTKKLN